MPQQQAYQKLINETIKTVYSTGSLDIQSILIQVLETLMHCERQLNEMVLLVNRTYTEFVINY